MRHPIAIVLVFFLHLAPLVSTHANEEAFPNQQDVTLHRDFIEFARPLVEKQRLPAKQGENLLSSCLKFCNSSGVNDPTRIARINDLAIAVACELGQFDAASESASRHVAWCHEHNTAGNSYHLQTAKANLAHLQAVETMPKEQQTQFADLLLKKSYYLLSLQTGAVIDNEAITETLNKLETVAKDFEKILDRHNWYTFETSYYVNRNSAVSEKWKTKIENLLAEIPETQHVLENHLLVAKMRISLAKYFARRGKTDEALELLKSVTDADQELGTPQENIGTVQIAHAEIEQQLGKPREAYLICREAAARFPDVAIDQLSVRDCEKRGETIGKLAMFEAGLGEIQNASEKLETVAKMWEKVAKFTPGRLVSLRSTENLLNLARFRIMRKNKTQAAVFASRAMTAIRNHFPTDSVFYRHHSMVAANIFANTGELERAQTLVLDALKNFDANSETESPQSLVSFLQPAVAVLQTNGDQETALELINEITEVVQSSQIPDRLKQQLQQTIDKNTSVVALRSGNRVTSFDLTEKAILNQLPLLRKKLFHFDEAETLVAASRLHAATLMLLAATDSKNPDQVKRAWNGLMQTKRVGSKLLTLRDRAIVEFDEKLGQRYATLRSAMSTAAFQVRHGGSDQFEKQLEGLEGDKELFFSDLPKQIETQIIEQQVEIDLFESVAKQLGPNEAFVDIVRNSRLRKAGKLQYQAFVMTRDGEGDVDSRLIFLGDVKSIDDWVNAWRSQFVVFDSRDVKRKTKPQKLDADSAGKNLYQQVWKPIAQVAGQKKTIVISGDGALSLLPWATLPDGQSLTIEGNKKIPGRLVDRYQFVDAISLRLLARNRVDKIAKQDNATMFVDIDYGTETEFASRENTNLELPTWTDLDQSTQEQTAFQQCFREYNSKLFTGQNATKQNLITSAPKSRFLHLSTHGYYLPSGASDTEFFDQLNQSTNIYRRNPWISCGLVFAGANQKSTAELVNNSALFSGEEAACLNYAGVDLVVLATCKSGEGEVFDGEGAFGMQHAFVLGGAKSSIGSYWAVSDSKTNLFMEQFYDSLATGVTVSEALHRAQLSFRQSGLAAKHWGAWMVSGNWKVTK